MTGVRLSALPVPPSAVVGGTAEISQLPYKRLPSMHRFSDRAGPGHDRRMRHVSCCLLLYLTASAPRSCDFAAQWLACWFPLSTLHHEPRGAWRMTRGLVDSPFLTSIELSSTISCQLCWRTKLDIIETEESHLFAPSEN